MKKVCFLNTIAFWGGGEKLHLEYALEFQRRGFEVCIVAQDNGVLHKKSLDNKIETISENFDAYSYMNPLKIFQLAGILKKKQIDTLIFTTSQDMKFGAMAAKIAAINNIVYLRGLAVPIKDRFLNKWLFKNVLTHIIANSEATKQTILKNLSSSIGNKEVKVIYHGIDTSHRTIEAFNQLEEISKNGKGLILGNAGRLTDQKGQMELIEIAQILKSKQLDFTIFIAGTGELEADLRLKIKEYNLDHEVILLGFIDDMDGFMNSIDIFLLTSQWEGFGFVLVEAMFRSKPVIAYHISSNPEIVKDQESGFLVPHKDNEMFADKIQLLIENPVLLDKMSKQAKSHVIDEFDQENRIGELINYINNSE